jgi:hypothetical protein
MLNNEQGAQMCDLPAGRRNRSLIHLPLPVTQLLFIIKELFSNYQQGLTNLPLSSRV